MRRIPTFGKGSQDTRLIMENADKVEGSDLQTIQQCPAPDDKWPNAMRAIEHGSPERKSMGLVRNYTEGTQSPNDHARSKLVSS